MKLKRRSGWRWICFLRIRLRQAESISSQIEQSNCMLSTLTVITLLALPTPSLRFFRHERASWLYSAGAVIDAVYRHSWRALERRDKM